MKIDIERLATCEANLTIEVEPERLEAAKKVTLTARLTGTVAGAALTATLEPYGWKGKLLAS